MKNCIRYRLQHFHIVLVEEIHGFFTDFSTGFMVAPLNSLFTGYSRQIFTVFSLFIFMAYRDFSVKTLVKAIKHFTKIFTTKPKPFASSANCDFVLTKGSAETEI